MMNEIPAPAVEMIPVDLINVVNPRVRNKRNFKEIVANIAELGLKKPITVTRRQHADGVRYELVCGQGRLEAFQTLGQSEIPALVIDATGEDCLVMSLVENIARRQHRAIDLLHDIEGLKRRGYSEAEIAHKTGLTLEYAKGIVRLLETREHRLLRAVEAGQIPVSVAVEIAESNDEGSHTNKQGRRNRYYISVIEPSDARVKERPALRLPAGEIESVVIKELARFVSDTAGVMRHLGVDQTDIDAVDQITDVAQGIMKQLAAGGIEAATVIDLLVARLKASDFGVVIEIKRRALTKRLGFDTAVVAPDSHGTDGSASGIDDFICLKVETRLLRHGAGKRIFIPRGAHAAESSETNRPLIRAIAQAYAWRVEMETEWMTIQDVATAAKLSRTMVSQRIALAYLAPDIIESVLNGYQPKSIQLEQVATNLPLDWEGQRNALLFKDST